MLYKIIRKLNLIKDIFNNKFWFLTPAGISNTKKLEKLKGAYLGKRCFIMGNGPSLLKCDLTLLKNEVTIASNAQYLIWDKMGFTPTFLTVEDRLVAEDRKGEINNIKNITKIFPKDLSAFLKRDSSTSYIDFLREHKPSPDFSSDFSKRVFWGGTVSYLNLQLAYYLGCTEIYLIGFDHSYKVPDKINNYVITSEEEDTNHIHPDYFGKGFRWHDPNVERMEVAYKVAREFLNTHNVKVANATVGGKLEVFKRVDYDTLF